MIANIAARFHAAGDIRLTHEDVPEPPLGHELVRVTAAGLCGSDLHWFTDGGIGDAVITAPLVGGHEFAGVVAAGPRAGTRVAVDPAIPCHHCDLCERGHRNLCRNVRFAGHSDTDGGYQQLLSWPSALLHPLPDDLTDADGAMLEPLGVAIHTVDLAHVPLGGSVAVVGLGPIGLCVVQLARVAGARRIVAADPLPHRRAAAARLGADTVLDPGAAGYAPALADAARGGVDVAFEIAGTDAAIAAAVDAVRPGGRVVLAGIPSTDDSAFPAATARRKGLTLVMVRRMKEVYPRAIDLVGSGTVDVRSLVTHRFPLTDIDEAFRAGTQRVGLKVIVEP